MLSYSMTFIKKTKSMRPPPLMFSWKIYKFLIIAEVAPEVKKRPTTLLKKDSKFKDTHFM